jgi:hypothetical protein
MAERGHTTRHETRARDGAYGRHTLSLHWRRAVLRSIGAYCLAGALLLLSQSAFRQALSELRDTEPGSLLFGVLQLVIGTSAVAAAIGLVKRARWAAPTAAIWGIATAALLAVQPLFEPMASDAQRSIGLGAALVVFAAAGVSWFARRLARGDTTPRTAAEQFPAPSQASELLAEGRPPAQPFLVRAPDAPVTRGTQRRDERRRAPDAPSIE